MGDEKGKTELANQQQSAARIKAWRPRTRHGSLPKLTLAQERVFQMLVLALREADEINRSKK